MPYSDASTQSANTPSRSPLPRTSSTTDTPDIAHLAAEETLEQGKSESSIPSLHLDIGGESMLADDFSSNPMAENFWMLPIDMPADVDSDRTIGDPTFSDKDLKPAPEFITTEASAADTTLGNESEKSFADGTAAIPSNVISRVECDQPLVNAFEGFDANFFGLTPAELDQVFQNYQKELEDTTEAGILSAHVSEGLSTDAEIMHRLHDFDLDKTKVTPNESTTAQSNEKSFKTIINHNPDEMAEEDCPAKSKMEDRLDHFDLDKARYLPSNEDVDVETPCEDTALGTSSKNPIPVDLSETSFEMSGSTVDSDGDASDGASDNENPSESDSNAIIAFDQAVRSFHPLRNSLAPNKAGKAKTGKGLRTQENGAKVTKKAPIRHSRRSNRSHGKAPNYVQFTRVDLLSRWDELVDYLDNQQYQFTVFKSKVDKAFKEGSNDMQFLKAEFEKEFEECDNKTRESEEQMEQFGSFLRMMAFD